MYIPLIPAERNHSEKIYEQEMQRGHIDLGIDKVVMFGIAGSGKTSALHALLGLDPPDQGSTPLMERPITVMVISGDDGEQWKKMTRKDVHERIAQIIRSRPVASTSSEHISEPSDEGTSEYTSEHTSEDKSEHASECPSEENSSTTASEPIEGGVNIGTVTTPEVEDTPGVQSTSQLAQNVLSKVKKEFVSLINTLVPSCEPIHEQNWVYLIDSGGQHEFHEVLPIFLNGASDFIYVLKLNDQLDKPPQLSYHDSSGEPVSKPYPSFLTNEEILKHCMHTIHSFTSKNEDNNPPQILILGTHRDEVKKEELSQKLKAVNNIVKLTGIKSQVVFQGENYVFPINAKEPDEKDKECAKKCQEILNQKHGIRRRKVPLRWYALEYMMQEAAQALERNVLSKDECLEIAKKLDINGESCEEALKFFNALNLLFYWPTILPDLVFVDTKVILDKVSELVKVCYQMKTTPSPAEGDWHDFLDYAKVTETRLKKFKTHYVYENQMFTPKDLIKLLKYLLVIAKLPNDEWFMPSLLKMVPRDKIEDYRVNRQTAMVVHFPGAYIIFVSVIRRE